MIEMSYVTIPVASIPHILILAGWISIVIALLIKMEIQILQWLQ